MAKEKGEWKSRVLHEVEQGSTLWRAEISTAPDGKEFAGVRKYVKKADGSVTPTASGVSFLYDGGSIAENVDMICGLFDKLRGGRVKIKPAAKTAPAKSEAKPKKAKAGSPPSCVLKRDGLYLCSARKEGKSTKVRKSDDVKEALRFADHAGAAAHAKQFNLSSAWTTEDV